MANTDEMVALLRAENACLQQRIAELERGQSAAATVQDITAPAAWQSWELLQIVIDTLPDPIFVKDLQHRWIACNQAFCTLMGYSYEDVIGYSDPDRFPADQASVFWEKDDEVFQSNRPVFNEELATGTDGITRTIWTRKFPLRDAQQNAIGLCGIITDISDLQQRRDRIERLEHELLQKVESEQMEIQTKIIESQSLALRELSTPLIPISDDAVIMPLIGTINEQRAQQILETLLNGVAEYHAETVIIDITGVDVVDTQVADALVRVAQAVRLLGARVIMTGVRPQIAQTLVQLGVDLGHIDTRNSLQAGIAEAFHLPATGINSRSRASSLV